MPSDDELRTKLLSNLAKYPLLERFFGEVVAQRIRRDGWLALDLIQILVKDKQENIQRLARLLEDLASSSESFNALRQKYSGTEQDDQQIRDLLAEVRAYSYLSQNGFSDISPIPETPNSKSPDFRAHRDGRIYLAESKNLRAPASLLNVIFNRLDELNLRCPELYGRFSYEIDATVEAPGESFDRVDEVGLSEWFAKLESAVQRGAAMDVQHRWLKDTPEYTLTRWIDCQIAPNSRYDVSGSYIDLFYLNEQRARNAIFQGFENKLLYAVNKAKRQLAEFRDASQAGKLILINWQKPFVVEVFDGIIQEVRSELIPKLNQDLRGEDQTLEVILMPE